MSKRKLHRTKPQNTANLIKKRNSDADEEDEEGDGDVEDEEDGEDGEEDKGDDELAADMAVISTSSIENIEWANAELDDELSEAEEAELKQHEATIKKYGIEAFMVVGIALAAINLKRLYRGKYKTFNEYCEKVHGIKRAWAYQLIKAAGVFDDLSSVIDTKLLPTSVNSLLALHKAPPSERISVYNDAVAKNGNKAPTADMIKTIVEKSNAGGASKGVTKSETKTERPEKDPFELAKNTITRLDSIIKRLVEDEDMEEHLPEVKKLLGALIKKLDA